MCMDLLTCKTIGKSKLQNHPNTNTTQVVEELVSLILPLLKRRKKEAYMARMALSTLLSDLSVPDFKRKEKKKKKEKKSRERTDTITN